MIEVTELNKSFKSYSSPYQRLIEALFGKKRHKSMPVLKNISFSLRDGETLGILGRNGAGKSTLLKLLAGVLVQDSGSIQTSGSVAALLELGTGFDPALSGAENIKLNGLLIGMSEKDIEERREDIVAFSELGEFIHQPLRTYSSGMAMRLAFSIAIHANPSCFIIDEALSVGDGHFQQKCFQRIKDFQASGGSIIFVSHDLNAVKLICDRVIVLEKGEVFIDTNPADAVNVYNKILSGHAEDYYERETAAYGNEQAVIVDAYLTNESVKAENFATGENCKLVLSVKAVENLSNVTVGMLIRDRFGQDIFGINTFQLGGGVDLYKGELQQFLLEFPLNIAPGKYTITLALHDSDHHLDQCYHWCDNIIQFEVAGVIGPKFSGVCRLPVIFSGISHES
ncbi:ABC transporter ATP-binding protein [Balneatrix alpica]|uniref:ABC transporter ATP-binding protein n=1 Tax=Balneatrix alpica TaxID=75684 RepID=A0ABV5ZCU2_9GAMM|nr:ABC transporter ATP-binding protein [Balneatrix alpica]